MKKNKHAFAVYVSEDDEDDDDDICWMKKMMIRTT